MVTCEYHGQVVFTPSHDDFKESTSKSQQVGDRVPSLFREFPSDFSIVFVSLFRSPRKLARHAPRQKARCLVECPKREEPVISSETPGEALLS